MKGDLNKDNQFTSDAGITDSPKRKNCGTREFPANDGKQKSVDSQVAL
jgi:hypothetical protein